MRIAEIFHSIQGEGRLVGMPSVFIRSSGCNLRCVWCDTPYTSWKPEGTELSVQAILRRVRKHACRHVVITGGEPLLARDLPELTDTLRGDGHHITIETAATIFAPVACDLISMSPKLANSTPWKRQQGKFAAMHEGRRLNFAVIQSFINGHDYQLKFVAERESDFAEIERILENLEHVDLSRVLVMAQARTKTQLREKSAWIIEQSKKHGFGYSPRLHIELFGNRRGT
ncbi:MAG: 7-carboxy-7-deazaguanine synthase QueE [Candidatus Binatia bacterium]